VFDPITVALQLWCSPRWREMFPGRNPVVSAGEFRVREETAGAAAFPHAVEHTPDIAAHPLAGIRIRDVELPRGTVRSGQCGKRKIAEVPRQLQAAQRIDDAPGVHGGAYVAVPTVSGQFEVPIPSIKIDLFSL